MLVWLERHQYLVLGLAVILLLSGLAFREITRPAPPPAFVIHSPASSDGPVVVHVAGAVAAPGVYELQPGARLHDALAAAGGVAPEADARALNLARPLRDGERVDVPGAPRSLARLIPPPETGEAIDINTASAAQLVVIRGIGEAYSRRIVDSRVVDGPFTSVDDLVARRILPQATLEAIRDSITVSAP